MFESVPGLECQKRVLTATEELDLSIANNAEDGWLSRMKPIILVECKNWAGPSDKNSLVAFEKKVENRRGQCDIAFFISWNGFTKKFETESMRSSHASYVIARLDRNLIKEAIETGTIQQTLFRAYFDAVNV
jgi:hypothetical protein